MSLHESRFVKFPLTLIQNVSLMFTRMETIQSLIAHTLLMSSKRTNTRVSSSQIIIIKKIPQSSSSNKLQQQQYSQQYVYYIQVVDATSKRLQRLACAIRSLSEASSSSSFLRQACRSYNCVRRANLISNKKIIKKGAYEQPYRKRIRKAQFLYASS